MSSSKRYVVILQLLPLLFLGFLYQASTVSAKNNNPQLSYKFTRTYDKTDQFFNFRFHIFEGKRRGRKEIFKSRRIPGVFAPDKKYPRKLRPRWESFALKQTGGHAFLLFVPRINYQMDGMSVVLLYRDGNGNFSAPLSVEDRVNEKMLNKLDYQSGIFMCKGGFKPENVSLKDNILGFFDSATGKTHYYSFDRSRVQYKGTSAP
ncbi:hypothetical protein ACFL35_09640 [Candidatus Riflebacteria bacterium]